MTASGRAALALAALLTLGACQDQEDPAVPDEPAAPPVVELYPGEATDDVTVTGTLAVVESGLTRVPLSTAIDYIASWQEQLGGGRVAGGDEIAQTLGELRAVLDRGAYEGSEIGPILVRLGQQTAAAAPQAEGNAQTRIRSLGRALVGAGRAMGGDAPLATR